MSEIRIQFELKPGVMTSYVLCPEDQGFCYDCEFISGTAGTGMAYQVSIHAPYVDDFRESFRKDDRIADWWFVDSPRCPQCFVQMTYAETSANGYHLVMCKRDQTVSAVPNRLQWFQCYGGAGR